MSYVGNKAPSRQQEMDNIVCGREMMQYISPTSPAFLFLIIRLFSSEGNVGKKTILHPCTKVADLAEGKGESVLTSPHNSKQSSDLLLT